MLTKNSYHFFFFSNTICINFNYSLHTYELHCKLKHSVKITQISSSCDKNPAGCIAKTRVKRGIETKNTSKTEVVNEGIVFGSVKSKDRSALRAMKLVKFPFYCTATWHE